MKPCGIILFAYELYISESKSQVYGLLHEVLAKWGLHEIGKCHKSAFSVYFCKQQTVMNCNHIWTNETPCTSICIKSDRCHHLQY